MGGKLDEAGWPARPERPTGRDWEARGSLAPELPLRGAMRGACAERRLRGASWPEAEPRLARARLAELMPQVGVHDALAFGGVREEAGEVSPVLQRQAVRRVELERALERAPRLHAATAAVGGMGTGEREAWVRGAPDRTPSAASTRRPRRCALEAGSGPARRQPGRAGSQP